MTHEPHSVFQRQGISLADISFLVTTSSFRSPHGIPGKCIVRQQRQEGKQPLGGVCLFPWFLRKYFCTVWNGPIKIQYKTRCSKHEKGFWQENLTIRREESAGVFLFMLSHVQLFVIPWTIPHGLYPTRLLCLWNFPGKNTGVGCCFLPQGNLPDPGI